MNLSALSTSCISGRFGTSQGKKLKQISDANFISFCRNSSSDSPFIHADSGESSDNIPTPSDTTSIVNSPTVPAHEVVRCSPAMHLPCNLEFAFSEKTTTQIFLWWQLDFRSVCTLWRFWYQCGRVSGIFPGLCCETNYMTTPKRNF